MPYKRSYYRGKRYARRKKKSYGHRSLAAVAYKRANRELKILNDASHSFVPAIAGDMEEITPTIAAGDSRSQRDGEKIMMKRLQLKGYCNMNASDTTPGQLVRVILFQYEDGSFPAAVTDVLSSDSINAYYVTSDPRLKILADLCFPIGRQGNQQMYKCINKVVGMNKLCTFDQTTSQEPLAVRWGVISYATVTTNAPQLTLNLRWRWVG